MSVYLELRCDHCQAPLPGRVAPNATAVAYIVTRMHVAARAAGWRYLGRGKKKWECPACIAAKTPRVVNMRARRKA